MPRRARIVVPGIAHHIVQRGNYKQNISESFTDFRHYCYLIKEYQEKYNIVIISYCLMNNHVHFIVVPKDATNIADFFKTVHMRYSQYKNLLLNRKGHLWQGRFFSSILDEAYLFMAIRYVERNPVRARIVENAWEYIWSSARKRIGVENDQLIKIKNDVSILGQFKNKISWREYLTIADLSQEENIRKKTAKGNVIGTEEFINKMEMNLGIRLKEGRSGRPKK